MSSEIARTDKGDKGVIDMQHSHTADLERKRQALAGPAGVAGLFKNPRLLAISIVTMLGGLNYGYEQGAYGQCLVMAAFYNMPAFSRIIDDANFKGISVAILGLGGWFGSLINGYCVDQFSRRWCMLGGAFICMVGGIITAAAYNSGMIFAGRFLIGVAVGSLSTAVPMYNSEISPAEVRGAMGGTWQLSVTFGIMISFWIAYGCHFISDTNTVAWRLPLAIQCIPAILLAIGTLFIPYSPRWLLKKGRDEEALRSLAWLRRASVDDEAIRLEFLEIKAEAIFEKESVAEKWPQYANKPFLLQFAQIKTLFSTWPMFKRTAIGTLMMFFQQMSGIDAIVFYAPIIFQTLGLKGNSVSLLASGVVGIAMFVATVPAIILMDKIGRRPLLIVGGLGMAACLAVVAGITGGFKDHLADHEAGAWTSAAFVWIYIACFGFSWGPVSWTVISEIFPLSVRAPGTALSASTNWMVNFCVSWFLPPMLESIDYGTYIFFLALCLLGVGYAVFLLPETRNVSLEAMDLLFGASDASRDEAKMAGIMNRLAAEYNGGAAPAYDAHSNSSYMSEKPQGEKLESAV